MSKVINEEFVKGLVKAMTAKKVQVGDETPTVDVRYMGNFYGRGHIFRVDGTKIEGTINEMVEAAVRADVIMTHLPRLEDTVVAKAEKKLAAAKKASTPR